MTALFVGESDSDVNAQSVEPGRRRLGLLIWALLFFNGLAWGEQPLVVPIPGSIGKLLTQGALAAALLLVLMLNRDRLIRPNLFLTLYSLLAALAMLSSLRMNAGLGSLLRAGRFAAFVAVLWLLTPLWGRRDRIMLQWHITCLTVILSSVALGGILAPGKSREVQGRLAGAIWPIPPTQVGHYGAVLAGIAFVLLMAKAMKARVAIPLVTLGVAMLLLSHTRTALIALAAALIAGILVLVTVRRRARQAATVILVGLALLATAFAPLVANWFQRGESTYRTNNLNGRTIVWDELLAAPRSTLETVIGHGLTNKSFNGLPIDSSWLSTYSDEGLLGVALCVAIIVCLLMLAATRPRGPALAVAMFIIVYCTIASTTETGLGDVSPYLLDLTIAASLLTSSAMTARRDKVVAT